ncbi:MAG: hypothetical protein K9G81_21405 [Rhodobacteraceae bacterium]|nr:hypothetical protein [Paracoccaceae bacterium]
MKTKYSSSLIAIAAVLGSASLAMADTAANSFGASVSVLSPDQTGFIIGGQVAVTGVGTGALTLSRSVANMQLTGAAQSGLAYTTGGTPELIGAQSASKINSELDFTRSITTSGAMVGLGSVVARGEAIAALGSAGAASADTSTSGTSGSGETEAAGTSTASASTQGSLNGSQSTSNTLQLLGNSGLFAGSNGLTVGEATTADAYGSSAVLGDGVSGVDLTNAVLSGDTSYALVDGTGSPVDGDPTTPLVLDLVLISQSGTGTGNGALFNVTSSLNTATTGAPVTSIGMNVANAGNGSISITTSTGGFFTGGAAASGDSSRNETGSFFGNLVD